MTDPAPQLATDVVVVTRLRRLMCLFTGLLVASTWPLWIPFSEFPDIPWINWFCDAPEISLEWMLLGMLAIWLVLEFWGLPHDRLKGWICRWIFMSPIFFVLVMDQCRMQPWVCQMLMLGTIVAIPNASTALRCARILTISIYLHSAISKVDMSFLESHGQWLLEGFAASVGLSTDMWSETMRRTLAGMFPIGELVTALLLAWPRTRRVGLGFVIVMHLVLLLSLGPWGHGHHSGVLLWNVYFVLMDLLIFRKTQPDEPCAPIETPAKLPFGISTVPTRTDNVAVYVLTSVFALLPCLSWWGLWDNWPSWAVYSSRPSIVEVYVPEAETIWLPESLQPFVEPPEPLSDECRVNLDAWSFATQKCPMYPQERYRVAIAIALIERPFINEMRMVIHGPPDRWTGERETTVFEDAAAIRQKADGYTLNAWPRDWWVWYALLRGRTA